MKIYFFKRTFSIETLIIKSIKMDELYFEKWSKIDWKWIENCQIWRLFKKNFLKKKVGKITMIFKGSPLKIIVAYRWDEKFAKKIAEKIRGKICEKNREKNIEKICYITHVINHNFEVPPNWTKIREKNFRKNPRKKKSQKKLKNFW